MGLDDSEKGAGTPFAYLTPCHWWLRGALTGIVLLAVPCRAQDIDTGRGWGYNLMVARAPNNTNRHDNDVVVGAGRGGQAGGVRRAMGCTALLCVVPCCELVLRFWGGPGPLRLAAVGDFG